MAEKMQVHAAPGSKPTVTKADAEAKPHSRRKAPTTMRVKVFSPRAVFFDDTASSISAANATGPFDILPQHHNFITLVEPGELEIRREGHEPMKIKIAGGVMHVKADHVTVFLDI